MTRLHRIEGPHHHIFFLIVPNLWAPACLNLHSHYILSSNYSAYVLKKNSLACLMKKFPTDLYEIFLRYSAMWSNDRNNFFSLSTKFYFDFPGKYLLFT